VIDPSDLEAIAQQLGREPRDIVRVAHRCPCGRPDVVVTSPRLSDGTPFPTVYYLTCPRAASAVGRLEGGGVMREMESELEADPDLREKYAAAHRDYLAARAVLGDVPEIDGVSAGGMPDRVKCLHVLLAHALAAGPGVNPLGDRTRELVGQWWQGHSCAEEGAG
jgi:hypothetical protein